MRSAGLSGQSWAWMPEGACRQEWVPGPGQADLCPRTVGWSQEGQPQAPKAGDVFHETWPGSHRNISLHLQEVAPSLLAPRPRLQLSQKGLLSPPAQQTGNDRAALRPGRAPLAATMPSMRIKSDIVAGNMAGFSPKVADLGGKGGQTIHFCLVSAHWEMGCEKPS